MQARPPAVGGRNEAELKRLKHERLELIAECSRPAWPPAAAPGPRDSINGACRTRCGRGTAIA